MKSFLFALLLIFAGCGTEAPVIQLRPLHKQKPLDSFTLYKNDITNEFTLYQMQGNRDWGNVNRVVYDGDSLGCMKFINDYYGEKRREEEQRKRDIEIKRAWHEVEFKVILDSAAAQTDRELKPQIDRLTKRLK